MSDDNFVLKEYIVLKPVKVPEGSVRCPECGGSGKVLVAYRDPGPNDYRECVTCLGKGYEEVAVLERLGWSQENGEWVRK